MAQSLGGKAQKEPARSRRGREGRLLLTCIMSMSSFSSLGASTVMLGMLHSMAKSKDPWCVAPSSPTNPARSTTNLRFSEKRAAQTSFLLPRGGQAVPSALPLCFPAALTAQAVSAARRRARPGRRLSGERWSRGNKRALRLRRRVLQRIPRRAAPRARRRRLEMRFSLRRLTLPSLRPLRPSQPPSRVFSAKPSCPLRARPRRTFSRFCWRRT